MLDTEKTTWILHELKEMGLWLSLDDFGAGYSFSSYLQLFPIDILKIDQSFIADIRGNAGNSTLTSMIISIRQTLKMGVIVEGIESLSLARH